MKESKLKIAQKEAEYALNKTNEKILKLGAYANKLYVRLNMLQKLFDQIRNVPDDRMIHYKKIKKIQSNWMRQVDKIEKDYNIASGKAVGRGVAGVSAGVAVASLGSTAAMGVATTFGVASTGTAISSLSGAAATNAALAWLGGGALSAGGGGMVAGQAFLALAGPVGWAIAGVAILSSGLLFWKAQDEKKCLENIFCLISKRDTKKYALAIVELNERIIRIGKECSLLESAIQKIKSFGVDYTKMTEVQQYELGAYVNLMNSSLQLLVNPILGLQPKFTEKQLYSYIHSTYLVPVDRMFFSMYKELIVLLVNMVWDIDMDEKDKKLFGKAIKNNKEFLSSFSIRKKDLDEKRLMNWVMKLKMIKY